VGYTPNALLISGPGVLESARRHRVLGASTTADGRNPHEARLFGAADAMRERSGEKRFKVYQVGHDTAVAAVRDALGNSDFDAAWIEGAALSLEDAIAYAQPGRGERKRPSSVGVR